MEYLLIIGALILGLIGFIGAILPGLPGTPLSFVSLLLFLALPNFDGDITFLVIMGAIALVITVLDYVIPIYGTKFFGGTKQGVRGSTIGLIVSVLVLPLLGIVIGPFGIIGLLLGPFLGALIGEVIAKNQENAFRAALGSFVGFLLGTFMKVVYAVVVLVFIVKDAIQYLF